MQNESTLYHSLTFLGNFCNSGKLSVFNSNMYTSKISMVKAILNFLLKLKMKKIILNNIKKILTRENDAPSKTHIMW